MTTHDEIVVKNQTNKLMSCVSPVTASSRGGTKMLKVWKCWLKIGAHSATFQISPSYIPSYSLYLCLCLLSALHLQSLLPVDSSMFLSVAECNWFCQSQSIDPRRAASAADSGGITVALAVATEMNLHFCICVFFFLFLKKKTELVLWLSDPLSRQKNQNPIDFLLKTAARSLGAPLNQTFQRFRWSYSCC